MLQYIRTFTQISLMFETLGRLDNMTRETKGVNLEEQEPYRDILVDVGTHR